MSLLKKYWPTMLTVTVILYATWLPSDDLPDDLPAFPFADKLIHAVMMGGFTGAILFDRYRASARGSRRMPLRTIIAVAASVAAFSVVDEVVQGLLPIGRPSDPYDLLADWLGCLIAALTAPPAIKKLCGR